MLTPEKIEEIRNNTRETIASEKVKLDLYDFSRALKTFKDWKVFFLKKNQGNNYARATRIIPHGCEDNSWLWICKLQLWKGTSLSDQIQIEADAFEAFRALPGWEYKVRPDIEVVVYRNPEIPQQ